MPGFSAYSFTCAKPVICTVHLYTDSPCRQGAGARLRSHPGCPSRACRPPPGQQKTGYLYSTRVHAASPGLWPTCRCCPPPWCSRWSWVRGWTSGSSPQAPQPDIRRLIITAFSTHWTDLYLECEDDIWLGQLGLVLAIALLALAQGALGSVEQWAPAPEVRYTGWCFFSQFFTFSGDMYRGRVQQSTLIWF